MTFCDSSFIYNLDIWIFRKIIMHENIWLFNEELLEFWYKLQTRRNLDDTNDKKSYVDSKILDKTFLIDVIDHSIESINIFSSKNMVYSPMTFLTCVLCV